MQQCSGWCTHLGSSLGACNSVGDLMMACGDPHADIIARIQRTCCAVMAGTLPRYCMVAGS